MVFRSTRHPLYLLGAAALLATTACKQKAADPVAAAAEALGVANISAIEYSGNGRWFQFGQAPAPDLPWPAFELSRYVAGIDYDRQAARVQIVRKQIVEPDRARPVPTEQKPEQYLLGDIAWNFAVPNNAPADTAPVATPQPATTAERAAEIWSTPHGFLKAAARYDARRKPVDGGTEVSFTTADGHRYVGLISMAHDVQSVQTWIDNPILGDTLVETHYRDYRDHDGLRFPSHIVRTQGGHPVLELQVTNVKANPALTLAVPETVAKADGGL